ncbi:MAG: hypothetical protein CSB48_14840 [Proteobacteria bacterium]|nr:MAG: hypothetical protein CSB48_14840 [Pseudomonadota bacterium]PIE39995.1 MAG: hypothetical protein CSA51_03105 [Gammaproteobacteria bacterium]
MLFIANIRACCHFTWITTEKTQKRHPLVGVVRAIYLKFDTGTVFGTSSAMAAGDHGLPGGGISLAQGGKSGYGIASGAFGKAVTVSQATC